MKDLSEIFSRNLKALRGNRSQKEFAGYLGLESQATYHNYESGRVPKAKVLEQIAFKLGMDAADLFRPITAAANAKIIPFDFRAVAAVGAAAAGNGRAYDDLEDGERVLAEAIHDPNAIAVMVEGDSMEPDFRPGQRIVVDTKSDLVPNKPVVLKDNNDRVFFKLYVPSGKDKIVLRSINSKYPDLTFSKGEFQWVYKAHGMYVRF